MTNKKNQTTRAIVVFFIYFIFTYLSSSWFYNHELFVSIHDLNKHNILLRLMDDLSFTCIPIFVVILIWKHREEYNLRLGDRAVSLFIGACFIFMFVSQKNVSGAEIYRAFFYLFFTAGCEECFFRGYLYHSFLHTNKILAVVLSGMMWGSCHAIMPAVFNNANIIELLFLTVNYLGGGIAAGFFFIYLQEKSHGIVVPILLHAASDYGNLGPFLFLGTIIWYLYRTKRTRKKELTAEDMRNH